VDLRRFLRFLWCTDLLKIEREINMRLYPTTWIFGVVPAALTKAYKAGMLSRIEEKTKQYLSTWMIG